MSELDRSASLHEENATSPTSPGKMFIGGLSPETTRDRLRDHFAHYGEIIDCVVMTDQHTGRTRGFGFVTYRDGRCCDAVLAARPHFIDGREVDPKMAVPREEMDQQSPPPVPGIGVSPAPQPTQQPRSTFQSRKVFVGGLPSNATDAALSEFFSTFGKIEEAVVIHDKQTRTPRGFGFVTFEDENVADLVVRVHFHEFMGKMVEVKRAEPKPSDASPSRLTQNRLRSQSTPEAWRGDRRMMYRDPMSYGSFGHEGISPNGSPGRQIHSPLSSPPRHYLQQEMATRGRSFSARSIPSGPSPPDTYQNDDAHFFPTRARSHSAYDTPAWLASSDSDISKQTTLGQPFTPGHVNPHSGWDMSQHMSTMSIQDGQDQDQPLVTPEQLSALEHSVGIDLGGGPSRNRSSSAQSPPRLQTYLSEGNSGNVSGSGYSPWGQVPEHSSDMYTKPRSATVHTTNSMPWPPF